MSVLRRTTNRNRGGEQAIMSNFTDSVDRECKGLGAVYPRCLREQCEHAKREPDVAELIDAVEDFISGWPYAHTGDGNMKCVAGLDGMQAALDNRDPDHTCEPSFTIIAEIDDDHFGCPGCPTCDQEEVESDPQV